MNNKLIDLLIKSGYLYDYSGDQAFTGLINNTNKEEAVNLLLTSFASLGYFIDKENLINRTNFNLVYFYHTSYKTLMNLSMVEYSRRLYFKYFPHDLPYYLSDNLVENNNESTLSSLKSRYLSLKYLITLKLVDDNETKDFFINYFNNTFNSKDYISKETYDYLLAIYKSYYQNINLINITNKANIVIFGHIVKEMTKDKTSLVNFINKDLLFINSLDDIRLFIEGINLYYENNENYLSLGRAFRRVVIKKIDEIAKNNNDIYDGFNKNNKEYKLIFKVLHLGEYKDEFSDAFKVFTNLNNGTYETFNSRLNKLEYSNPQEYLSLLSSRSTLFLSKLALILSNSNFNKDEVFSFLKEVVIKADTYDVIKCYNYFNNITKYDTNYVLIPGEKKRYCAFTNNKKEFPQVLIYRVLLTLKDSLTIKFKDKPFMNDIYLDESLKSLMTPFDKNAKTSFLLENNFSYGTRIKLNTINNNSLYLVARYYVDKPLMGYPVISLFLINDSLTILKTLSSRYTKKFSSLKIKRTEVDSKNYIDEIIEINGYKQLKNKYRYLVVKNGLINEEDCDKINVANYLSFTSKTSDSKPMMLNLDNHKEVIAYIIDLEKDELILVNKPIFNDISDFDVDSDDPYSYEIKYIISKALMDNLNLYDFFMLHKEHLKIVNNKEEAKFIISGDKDSSINLNDIKSLTKDWF